MKSKNIFSCFHGKSTEKDRCLKKAVSIRTATKFANQTSQHKGFNSLNWLTEAEDANVLDFAQVLGIPSEVAYAYKYFYENQLENFQLVPEKFISSLEVGSDLSDFWRRYFYRVMTDSNFSPLRHDVHRDFIAMYETLVDLYETNASREDRRWRKLELRAREAGKDASIWFNSSLLSYEFSAAWMVARACAFFTRPSPWWAPAMLGRLLCLDGAHKVQVLGLLSKDFEDNHEIVELFELFTSMLSSQLDQVDSISTDTAHSPTLNSKVVTPKLMSKKRFWEIVEGLRNNKLSQNQRAKRFEKELMSLNGASILEFDHRLQDLVKQAYRADIFKVAYSLNGGCSDEAFYDFIGWLILQGRKTFEATVKDPEYLLSVEKISRNRECRFILEGACLAYEAVTESADFEQKRAFVPLSAVHS